MLPPHRLDKRPGERGRGLRGECWLVVADERKAAAQRQMDPSLCAACSRRDGGGGSVRRRAAARATSAATSASNASSPRRRGEVVARQVERRKLLQEPAQEAPPTPPVWTLVTGSRQAPAGEGAGGIDLDELATSGSIYGFGRRPSMSRNARAHRGHAELSVETLSGRRVCITTRSVARKLSYARKISGSSSSGAGHASKRGARSARRQSRSASRMARRWQPSRASAKLEQMRAVIAAGDKSRTKLIVAGCQDTCVRLLRARGQIDSEYRAFD